MQQYQCNNPDCIENGEYSYIFTAATPQCPKCGNKPPWLATVAVIHYLYPNPKGQFRGYKGRRSSAACTNKLKVDPFNATSPSFLPVSCKKCQETAVYKKAYKDYTESLELMKKVGF